MVTALLVSTTPSGSTKVSRRVAPGGASSGTNLLRHTAKGAAEVSKRHLTRPLPLNTVALLKCASERLHIGAGDAMHYAEKLYLAGLTSYPRTETSKYAAGFDLDGTLGTLSELLGARE